MKNKIPQKKEENPISYVEHVPDGVESEWGRMIRRGEMKRQHLKV